MTTAPIDQQARPAPGGALCTGASEAVPRPALDRQRLEPAQPRHLAEVPL